METRRTLWGALNKVKSAPQRRTNVSASGSPERGRYTVANHSLGNAFASGIHDVFCDKISDVPLQSSNVSASGQLPVPLFLDFYLSKAPLEILQAIFFSLIGISSWMICLVNFFYSLKNAWVSL